jgi:ABC-type polysaccharide/polyol phosphate transport system ATPase subunit
MSRPTVDNAALPAVAVRSVSKTFRVPEEQRHTLKERVLHPRKKIKHQSFDALKDVTFDVKRGEFFGIAGRNGSGKSTLLKCMAGIYHTRGDIWVRGRMSTLIELGIGFNQDMAARDNVVMNGIMLGLSPREARKRYEAVIDFAELREFQDLKLKNYSSGMSIRLAFSVAIQVDAEILLIDEVLAVGDASFQQKCFDVFNKMRDQGRTIVFVTHDMVTMPRFCHRAMLLERGNMVYLGEPEEVATRYLELNFGRDPTPDAPLEDSDIGDGEARVLDAWVVSTDGERMPAVPQHERITLKVRILFMVDVDNPNVSVHIHNERHEAVIVATTWKQHDYLGDFRAGEEIVVSFQFDNVLAPGRYSPVFTIAHQGTGLDVIGRFEGRFSFIVSGPESLGGTVDPLVDTGLERVAPSTPRSVR